MKLFSLDFEKRIRKSIRLELRANSALKVQRKDRTFQKPLPPGLVAAGITFIFTVLLVSAAVNSHQPALGYAALAVWATGSALRRSRQLQNLLYVSDDLGVLYQLPIADEGVFQLQWYKFLRQAGIPFLNLLVAYCGLGLIENPSFTTLFIAVPTAMFQSALIIALSLHIAVWLPYLPLNAISSLLTATAFIIAFFWSNFTAALPEIINVAYWSNPSGWINYASVQSSRFHDYQALLLLLPVSLIIVSARISLFRLRENYQLHEPFSPIDEPELTAESGVGFFRAGAGPGETEIHDRILSGEFRRAGHWNQLGWVERMAARCMSRRQRSVAEFLVAGRPGWSGQLRWGMILAAISSVVVLFFGEHGGFVVYLPAYLLASALLPLTRNEWRGLQTYPTAGLFSPIYALFPISYDELLATVLKINTLRCVAAFPALGIYGAIAAAVLRHPALLGITLAAKITVAAIALQPLCFAFRISSGSNDTSKGFPWHLCWIIPLLMVLVCFLFGAFTMSNRWLAAACLVALAMLSFLVVFIQRTLYRRAKFDLLTLRGEMSEP